LASHSFRAHSPAVDENTIADATAKSAEKFNAFLAEKRVEER